LLQINEGLAEKINGLYVANRYHNI